VDAGDGQLLPRGALVIGQHAFYRELGGVDDLGVWSGVR